MDTPDKKTQPSPSSFLNKFEDSPVFSYISGLSPITSDNLSRGAQSFPLFGFSSPQLFQTPPPTNSPKTSNLRSVGNIADEPEDNGYQNGNKSTVSETSGISQPANMHSEDPGKFLSGREETVKEIDESSRPVDDLSVPVKYEYASPDSELGHYGAAKSNCEFNMAEPEILPAKAMRDVCGRSSLVNETNMRGIEVEHTRDTSEWEKFVYEASDILICSSPTIDPHQKELDSKNIDSGTLSFVTEVLQGSNDNTDEPHKIGSPYISTESSEEAGKQKETSQAPAAKPHAVFTEEAIHYSRTNTDDKQQQTTLRRCLIYEMSGSHYRQILSDPVGSTPSSISAANSSTSNKKYLARNKGSSKFSAPFPGIGLHLNALAAAGREKIIVNRQNLTCRRQLISSPCTMTSTDSLMPNTGIVNSPVVTEVGERGPEAQKDLKKEQKDSTQLNENVCENTAFGEGAEIPQNSPKKKRNRSDNMGGTDSCKRCNCKRSKCLKLYCECFAAGLYCAEPCNCQDCFNNPAHESTVLETRRQIESRNPLAFAPKVISVSGTPSSRDEPNKTPASARHKRGCNCKKSGCLKKYCECYQGGVGCSLGCRCEGCKNTFGQKKGFECNNSIFEEAKIMNKCTPEVNSYDEISKTEAQDEAEPEPLENARQPLRLPFHLGITVPQLPLLPCGQSLESDSIPENDNLNPTVSEEAHKTVPDDEASDGSRDDYLLPATSVMSTSPNSKRISSHHDLEASPGWKSCRKLILRSIPTVVTVSNDKEIMELQGKLQ